MVEWQVPKIRRRHIDFLLVCWWITVFMELWIFVTVTCQNYLLNPIKAYCYSFSHLWCACRSFSFFTLYVRDGIFFAHHLKKLGVENLLIIRTVIIAEELKRVYSFILCCREDQDFFYSAKSRPRPTLYILIKKWLQHF